MHEIIFKELKAIIILSLLFVIVSCGRSSFNANGLIQKRKYTKGYYFNSIALRKSFLKNDSIDKADLILNRSLESNLHQNKKVPVIVIEKERPSNLLSVQSGSFNPPLSTDVEKAKPINSPPGRTTKSQIKPKLSPISTLETRQKGKPFGTLAVIFAVLIPISLLIGVAGSGTAFFIILAGLFCIAAVTCLIVYYKKLNSSKKPVEMNNDKVKSIEPVGLSSFLLFTLTILFLLIAFFGTGTSIFFTIAFFSSLVSLLLSIISLIRFKKNPGKFKGKALTFISLYASSLLIFAFLIRIIILSVMGALAPHNWFNIGGGW